MKPCRGEGWEGGGCRQRWAHTVCPKWRIPWALEVTFKLLHAEVRKAEAVYPQKYTWGPLTHTCRSEGWQKIGLRWSSVSNRNWSSWDQSRDEAACPLPCPLAGGCPGKAACLTNPHGRAVLITMVSECFGHWLYPSVPTAPFQVSSIFPALQRRKLRPGTLGDVRYTVGKQRNLTTSSPDVSSHHCYKPHQCWRTPELPGWSWIGLRWASLSLCTPIADVWNMLDQMHIRFHDRGPSAWADYSKSFRCSIPLELTHTLPCTLNHRVLTYK